MYFDILPSIKYDAKPISYPFSEADFVVAKNFFRRYKISDSAFSYSSYYNKYAVEDGQRLDQIAEKVYGNPFYDWVIVLTNNIINPSFALPLSESELRKHVESTYPNPYYDIHHYEIISNEEQINKFGKVLIPERTWVDETFYNNKEEFVVSQFPDLDPGEDVYPLKTDYIFSLTDLGLNGVLNNSLSVGASIVTYGSGTGVSGGFTFYPQMYNKVRSNGYLRIGATSAEPRQAVLNPLDTTNYQKISIYAKYGTNENGAEWPDVAGEFGEKLSVAYRNDVEDDWTVIGDIIPVRMAQSVTTTEQAIGPGSFGGPGRVPGVYENVRVYKNEVTTPVLVNVYVDAAGGIEKIEVVDKGFDLDLGFGYYVKNEDIGNGWTYNSENQAANDEKVYLTDLSVVINLFEDINGIQSGRYDTEPFIFSVDLPQEARTTSTEIKFFQPSNTGPTFDWYGIQTISFIGTISIPRELGFDYTEITPNYYIIDGVVWINEAGAWLRKVRSGYKYLDSAGSVVEVSGSELADPITDFAYEANENEKKREIYILKPSYLSKFVDDFKKASLYKKSSDYVSNILKKTGV